MHFSWRTSGVDCPCLLTPTCVGWVRLMTGCWRVLVTVAVAFPAVRWTEELRSTAADGIVAIAACVVVGCCCWLCWMKAAESGVNCLKAGKLLWKEERICVSILILDHTCKTLIVKSNALCFSPLDQSVLTWGNAIVAQPEMPRYFTFKAGQSDGTFSCASLDMMGTWAMQTHLDPLCVFNNPSPRCLPRFCFLHI